MPADLDREIDRAVREMLDVEPAADLRDRVLDRIGRPAPGWKWSWVAVPVAAAAVVALAVVFRPAAPAPIAGRTIAANVPTNTGAQLPAEAGSHGIAHLPAEAGSHGVARLEANAGTHERSWLPASAGRDASASGGNDVAIAPLATPAPITVRPLEPRAMSATDVTVERLPAIAPISIEPLPAERGRH